VQSYFTFKVLHLNKDTRFKGEENSFADWFKQNTARKNDGWG
jgi:hypothetical protein